MNKSFRCLLIFICTIFAFCFNHVSALENPGQWKDRYVWIFGFDLNKDNDVPEIIRILETAARNKFNGAVISAGLDVLTKQPQTYFQKLDQIKNTCSKLGLELIPGIFSVGYGGGILSYNKNLAEGLPVTDALFVSDGEYAIFQPTSNVQIKNGDFEIHDNNRFPGFAFHDQPGVVSFVDTNIFHSKNASIRFENFTANQWGHGRIMQELTVLPHKCYKITLWVKTENLQPSDAFQILVLADGREIAPRKFNIPQTTDWQKISLLFNSLDFQKVRVYAGTWNAKSGKLWIDDWQIQEVGPLNILHRPGTPVKVKSRDSSFIYSEGIDYAKLEDKSFNFWNIDRPWPELKILPGSRIKPNEHLLVSWYHPMVIYDSQITICMAEPEIYKIWDSEAKLLSEKLHPTKVLLSMDEIRMGGTCEACKNLNMAMLLGRCISNQCNIIRKYWPDAKIMIWSDMLDPNHNAKTNYYLVKGSFAESWNFIPKEMQIVIWGGEPRKQSLDFFTSHSFDILVACYYDEPNLENSKKWIDLSKNNPCIKGFMYTTWEKKYELLPAFGKLLSD